MTTDQAIIFATLALALSLFITGKWRYDIVALMALMVVVLTGIVPVDEAFTGFGHPAVITVIAVLVISRCLGNAGVVGAVARWLSWAGQRPFLQVPALSAVTASASAFMNNVGALALMMPVAIRMARQADRSPSILLMPIAFASLLGGLTTMIGTPPNIIVATYRADVTGEAFGMFDYTPVGFGVALAGIFFVSLIGWRLIPQRKGQASREELFEIEDYLTEVRVDPESPMIGKTLRDLQVATKTEITVTGLLRGGQRLPAPSRFELLRAGDVLILEADSDELSALLDDTGLKLAGSEALGEEALKAGDLGVFEAVVGPASIMVGKTVRFLDLRWRYGINMLAVARRGQRLKTRLSQIRFQPGDVLLLQGKEANVYEALPALGCLPLAERGLRLGQPRRIVFSLGIFGGALALAATGQLPPQVALVGAALLMVLARLISVREVYESIEWSIVVLLGALIPVGMALETTGGAALIADQILRLTQGLPPLWTLVVLLVAAMTLSDMINNAAAAVLMAPIGLSLADGIGASADPFLMAVAIGASCAFLTPIGHQSNTLVMGPGGYKFGDYWRMGLPLEIVIAVAAIPLILHFWPLFP